SGPLGTSRSLPCAASTTSMATLVSFGSVPHPNGSGTVLTSSNTPVSGTSQLGNKASAPHETKRMIPSLLRQLGVPSTQIVSSTLEVFWSETCPLSPVCPTVTLSGIVSV